MQVALCIVPHFPAPMAVSKNWTATAVGCPPPKVASSLPYRITSIKAMAVAYELSVVDYNSSALSVFPAEACETIGGEACVAEIYPEVTLKAETRSNIKTTAWELIDREYLDYNDPKSVLKGDACDVLGGEFCERPYQRGVY